MTASGDSQSYEMGHRVSAIQAAAMCISAVLDRHTQAVSFNQSLTHTKTHTHTRIHMNTQIYIDTFFYYEGKTRIKSQKHIHTNAHANTRVRTQFMATPKA